MVKPFPKGLFLSFWIYLLQETVGVAGGSQLGWDGVLLRVQASRKGEFLDLNFVFYVPSKNWTMALTILGVENAYKLEEKNEGFLTLLKSN